MRDGRNDKRSLSWARLMLWSAGIGAVAAAIVLPRLGGESTGVISTAPQAGRANEPGSGPSDDDGSVRWTIERAEDVYEAMVSPPAREANGEPSTRFNNDRTTSPHPHVDASGQRAKLSAREAAAMRANAAGALKDLFTPELAAGMNAIVEGAISRQTGGDFVVSGGGARVKSFDEVTINGDRAQVKATVSQWSRVGQVQPNGDVRWATPEADVLVLYTLVRDVGGGWLISQRDWNFAAGHSP